MAALSKRALGAYHTVNFEYILSGLDLDTSDDITFVEPFVGKGDLLPFIMSRHPRNPIETYDLRPSSIGNVPFEVRNVLLKPLNYTNKCVITNPPYLAKNKINEVGENSELQQVFALYPDVDDLYKCFLLQLLDTVCLGGILILPVNFFSSSRKNDVKLRLHFLQMYRISLLNIFEERVFPDTSTTVCSFNFSREISDQTEFTIYARFFGGDKSPSDIVEYHLSEQGDYIPGGTELAELIDSGQYTVSRVIGEDRPNTHIVAKTIDDSKESQLGLFLSDSPQDYVDTTPNKSSRAYMALSITPEIDLETQERIVKEFNLFLGGLREKYRSLFLTNFRESTRAGGFTRKRISFDLVYRIIKHRLTVR